MDLLTIWKGYRRVVIIDAMEAASPAGEPIVIFAAHQSPLPTIFEKSSTHGMGPAESIELARALGELPDRVFVVGVAGRDFSPGTELSAAVSELVPQAVARTRALIEGENHA
jgi:hydrogenase maturation protease